MIPAPIPIPTLKPVAASPTIFQLSATSTQTLLPPTKTLLPTQAIKRVLIISIDGLHPDAIALAPMPNLLALMQSGAYSLTAQTIYPSV